MPSLIFDEIHNARLHIPAEKLSWLFIARYIGQCSSQLSVGMASCGMDAGKDWILSCPQQVLNYGLAGFCFTQNGVLQQDI
jgi:hypothetical protein